MSESLGTVLRQKRESLGLSLQDVERKTYIRARFLAAIESDDLSTIPSEAQARGFIRTYAAYLGMDGEELLGRAGGSRPKPTEVLARPTSPRPASIRSPARLGSPWRRFVRLDVLLNGALAVLVVGLLFWGSLQLVGFLSRASAQNPPASSMVLSSGTQFSPAQPEATSTQGSDTGGVVAAVGEPGELAGLTPQATPLGGVFTTVMLRVVAKHESYMRVLVDGKEAFSGRLTSGDIQTFEGNRAVALYVGDASAVQVEYDGQDQGSLGTFGQVLIRIWTLSGAQTATPTMTPTPLPTGSPTPTSHATALPVATTVSPGG
jgi:cytoskeletal protein RodZ